MRLTGLPKFDDLKNYGISTNTEKHLWTLEIRRLTVDAASEDALIFDIRNFKDARTRLTTRYEQDEEKVKARRPKLLESADDNRKVYFALVDYITSQVARLVVRSATGDYWNHHSLAILAKWSAKLKILSYNPAQYASLSLAAAEELLERMNDSKTEENLQVLKVRATDAKEEDKEDMDINSQAEADITGYYFQDHYGMQVFLSQLFNYAVNALYASEKTGNPPNCFEVCTLAYETGLRRSLTVISSDRRGDVAATSDATHVTCSYTAFQNLRKNVEHLKAGRQPPRDDARDQTHIHCQYTEGSVSEVHDFRTSRFDDIVSIMIPLSLTDPFVAIGMGLMLDFATGNSEDEDPVLQFERKHFTAKFVVTTAAWEDRQHKLKFTNAARQPDLEVLSVSQSPLSKAIRAGTSFKDILATPPEPGTLDPLSSGGSPGSLSQANLEKQRFAETRMNEWIISELTVTLKCHRYVYTILCFCAVLICGATAVPFSVQNRLKGVDPFNITTFAWLLAGFILVIAKSRYVCEWPWHDFLRGRVVCKSIKEMADVTGIDDQMILTSLLHNERDTTLITKGPYNGMFDRRAESGNEGFSIDIPVHLSTMLASGFIVLKVLSVKDDDSDVNEEVRENPHGTARKKIMRLSRIHFTWTKVLGVYVKDSLFG
ncbi:uncharacterized protein J4E78_005678 [Alternaria triticimaculans]|uniref:uncharacterized protein n=1 Tax=Alternaria triticimaculans TaxID=297637 RepID=UPI0020C58EE8|nr:uncharacterized protein J4E78_005678 [Alternaria triticimaculans]KAI4659252.1 hypothetical protein J4E78_005678 [Alternaria triticimaculans]